MKRIFSLLALVSVTFAQAQFNQDAPWMKDLNIQARKSTNTPITFQETVDAFNAYWETRDPNVKGSGYKPFKRWENYWANFVKKEGTLPTSKELWDTYLEVNNAQNNKSSNQLVDDSNWVPVGPFTHSNTGSWSSGQGRVNVVVPDPKAPTTVYAGAPAGGLWKSTDSGLTWATTTDNLPQIGVSGIAVDPTIGSNTIYIATGDDDAGDSFSVGVMKSTDGGQTWLNTGLSPGNSPSRMNDIYIDPNNADVLWVATNNGVYKTTNGGTNWINFNGTAGLNIRDIKIKPQDTNIIYAVSSTTFYKSTDAGTFFSVAGNGLPTSNVSRIVIDVTVANPNVVYALVANGSDSFEGLYKSVDSGNNFVQVANPTTVGDIFESSQTWYDMAFAISDTDENEVYTGVLNIWKGAVNPTINQSTFTKVNNWNAPNSASYSHADIHYLRFFNGELFAGTDGGFYKSSNGGTSFTDLTAGMQISQFYKIAVSKQSSDKMVGGLQDNGGHAYNNNQWQNYYGADGMDTAIDPNNSDIYYGFTQRGGGLYISTNAGASSNGSVGSPAGETGNWVTPLFMNSASELYSGYNSLYKLENGSWVAQSASFGTNIDRIEIDDLNPDHIYVATNSTLRKSTDRGVTFTAVETFSSNITSIEVNNSNSDIIYVTLSGSNSDVKKSTDGGLNFTNITTGLPSVTRNSLKHQDLHPQNPLFLGTSLGVYRYADDTGIWEPFNIGLPNVTVTDLEVNVYDDKITAATYGRGIWQSTIPTQLAQDDVKVLSLTGVSTEIECSAGVSAQVEVQNNGVNTINSVNVSYFVDGTESNFTWTGTIASEAIVSISIPQFSLTKGMHTFNAEATIVNDTYVSNNNSELRTILANDTGATQVVNTFQTISEELLVFDEGSNGQYWERGVPTGILLNDSANPSNQVYGTNLAGDHVSNTKSYLVSECYDLTTLSNPEIKFDMAFELELDWDIVYMEYSTDQGLTWSILGASTDLNWYNSATTAGQNNTCFNCPGAQWTGTSATLTEYSYDLTALSTESNIMFRFVFHSDEAVVEEGAIIDNFAITGNLLSIDEFNTSSFSVYPNPSKGVFNINTKAQEFNYSVYDVSGKLVLKQNDVRPSNNNHTIDISGYAPGVYFLNLSNKNAKITKKLLLN